MGKLKSPWKRLMSTTIINASRYLNTASITSKSDIIADLLSCYPNYSSDCIIDKLILPKGVSLFFSPNATQSILAIIEHKIISCNFSLDNQTDKELVHPIFYKALCGVCKQPGHGSINITTLMHWITGEFSPAVLFSNKKINHSDSLLIVDAVQAIGTLRGDEIQAIFNLVLNGAIVVGCLQKWIGCPVPLGFALLPTSMLEDDSALQQHLAIRDYLGPSICERTGYDTFPDTYSASLAPVFNHPLHKALGSDLDASEMRRKVIETNRDFICESISKSRTLRQVPTENDCRGMVAVSAATEESERISQILFKNGFIHTIFHDWPDSGTSTLRLSAPLVEMDAGSRNLFQKTLSE